MLFLKVIIFVIFSLFLKEPLFPTLVLTEHAGKGAQPRIVPITSEFREPAKPMSLPESTMTSDAFLADTGGIRKADPVVDSGQDSAPDRRDQAVPAAPDAPPPAAVPVREPSIRRADDFLYDSGPLRKPDPAESAGRDQETQDAADRGTRMNHGTYARETCEEIPYGSTCATFYVGGKKFSEITVQEYSEGSRLKGSSWTTEHIKKWDLSGQVIQNEYVRVQSEWQHDEEKDYRYIQKYRNGILIDEKYEERQPHLSIPAGVY